MEIKLNLTGSNNLYGYKINKSDNPNIMSQKLKEAKADNKNILTETNILSYFYNHFYGQVKIYYEHQNSIPKTELNINLSKKIYYQTLIDGKSNSETNTNENIKDETSEKLFNSIKELGGNNPNTINRLKNTMIKGYKKVEKEVGNMPEISKATLDKVIQKTDSYISEIQANKIDMLI